MSAGRNLLIVVLLFSSVFAVVGVSQNVSNDTYERALDDLLSQGRTTSLEIFLEDHPNSPLCKDALELLIWNYQQNHLLDKAAWAARSLVRVDPENAAALAVMAESGEAMTSTGPSRAGDVALTRSTATRGLLALPGFTAPHGVSAALFDVIRREVKATLDSALGMAALSSNDYLTAQIHLREAVKSTPEDVDRLYSLALAYLLATPPDSSDGMWFLARVSNLAATQLSSQADEYGRKVSRSLYGSESHWEELLRRTEFDAFPDTATRTSAPVQEGAAPASSSTNDNASENIQNSAVLKIKAGLFDANQVLHVVSRLEITIEKLDGNHGAYSRTITTDESGMAQLTLPAGRYGIVTPRGIISGQQWYTWNLEVVAGDPPNYIELTNQNATPVHLASPSQTGRAAPVSRAVDPIFLGIVVDTSVSMGDRLSAVKNSLLASLRQLPQGEQAFLVENGGGPRIVQGLTSDASLLQGAISRMTPNGRNALYDGVITAANYLRERAGHGTLALLVIADGVDTASRSTLKQAVATLRSLPINTFCIGTSYNNHKLHDSLTRLASNAGDEALFPRLSSLTVVSQSVLAAISEQPSPSAPRPLASADASPPSKSPRPLHGYSVVTVKQFVVQDGSDTSDFPAGDEALLQKLVVGRIRKYTDFREVDEVAEARDYAESTSQANGRLTLAGIVVGYNTGGRVRRGLLSPFGGVMTLTVRYVFRDAQSGDEIFRTELTSTGGPVFIHGSVEEMRSQAMLRMADALIKAINRTK